MNIIQIFIFFIFCVNATISGEFFIRFILEKKPPLSINRYVSIILLSSVIWSLGMGFMSLQENDSYAYIFRTIGILGTFVFMASVQVCLCLLSGIPEKIQKLFNVVAFLGIPIFVMYSVPGQTIFVHNNIGTTFYFRPGLINDIYSLYFTVVSLNIFIVSVYTVRHNPYKRVVVAGKRLLCVEMCIFFGAIFDMLVPSAGMPAFPGSAITHFWGVIIFWIAIHNMYKSELTVANMSEYVYHSLTTPVMIFSTEKKLSIINSATASFCKINEAFFSLMNIRLPELFDVPDDVFEFEENGITIEATCKANGAHCDIIINKIKDQFNDVIGFICLVSDQTEHNLALTRLEQAKLAADAANMSKSVFLANMSHEIRTPMNAILGFSDIALMEDVDDKSKEYFREIKQSGNVLLSVINDVLNVSKIELGKHEVENANYMSSRIIKDVETITRSNANKKNLTLDVIIDSSFPEELFGDSNKIREILLNILGNSVKYTTYGGIKFTCSSTPDEGNNATIHFEIADTGIGIKEEDIPTIFDKFSRVDKKLTSSIEGTGLGLSITKGLVELLGGTINVKSTYGIGTTFTVDIPQVVVNKAPMKPAKESDEKAEVSSISDLADGKHFLIVDDTSINLKVAAALMSKYGAEIDTCTSGAVAIEKCKLTQYDIVFMDHMMPEMDGVEAMKKIRLLPGYEAGSPHKIVALTANAMDDVREMMLSSGFDGFISKPIKKEALTEVIMNS